MAKTQPIQTTCEPFARTEPTRERPHDRKVCRDWLANTSTTGRQAARPRRDVPSPIPGMVKHLSTTPCARLVHASCRTVPDRAGVNAKRRAIAGGAMTRRR